MPVLKLKQEVPLLGLEEGLQKVSCERHARNCAKGTVLGDHKHTLGLVPGSTCTRLATTKTLGLGEGQKQQQEQNLET